MLTYKEITSQPEAMELLFGFLQLERKEIESFFKEAHSNLIFIGSGSSYLIAKSVADMYTVLSGNPAYAFTAGEILLRPVRAKKLFQNSIAITFSRSGQTSELIKAVEILKEAHNAKIFSFICSDGSKLSELSDCCFEMSYAFDESVCQTRSVTCMYLAAQMIFTSIINKNNIKSDLESAAMGLSKFIKQNEPELKSIGESDFSSAVVLADGEISGICEEGALAFKEISQIPSNRYSVLDVRHGPIVLIGEGTLVLVCGGELRNLELNLIKDLVKKNARVVVYSDLPIKIEGVYANINFGKNLDYVAKVIPFIVMCQLIAYYKAIKTGVNPDQPTGLDAWISLK